MLIRMYSWEEQRNAAYGYGVESKPIRFIKQLHSLYSDILISYQLHKVEHWRKK